MYPKYGCTAQLLSGVILLKVCILEMPSYTYAVKSEKLLKSRGYSCEIKRSESSSGKGCGYSLKIFGECGNAAEILDNYSVPYTDIVCGGA